MFCFAQLSLASFNVFYVCNTICTKMKELMLSTLEKEFILKAIAERTRLDGREANTHRDIRVSFGEDHGCCFVNIGETKVICRYTCFRFVLYTIL